MQQVARILRMLRELPRGRGYAGSTAQALAKRYDVSERSIYRDLALLQEAGCAVANDGGGYYLLATDQTIPVELTSLEMGSLLYAVGLVREAVPGSLGSELQGVLDKLAAACGSREVLQASLQHDGGIEVRPPIIDGPLAVGNLQVAIRARRTGRCLQGYYRSPETDQETRRVIHPYAISYRGNAHYLVGYCELRRGARTFRLDRFRELEVMERPAQIPDEYDPQRHFAGAWQVTGGRRQRVRLRLGGLAARRLASAQVHPSQTVVARSADETVLELEVAPTEEFRSWVLSLGPEAEVIAPQSLRRRLSAAIRGMLGNYG